MLPRRLVISAATFAVTSALALALSACGEQVTVDPRSKAPLVRAALVQPVASASRSFTGIVGARVQSDLGFRVSGKVLERLVDAGQTVRRGQPLMRIDPVDLKLAAQAQQEAVSAARARAQQTAEDEARYRDLRGTGAISASAYDQARAAADAARAQLSAAQAQADVARNASRYAELVADGDGVVMETLAEPGQVVNAGQAVVRLAHAGRREAVVQLPETLRPALGSAAQATLFGNESAVVPAKLRQLSDAADRLTRTFEARYVLEGELANAPLGATVTIEIADRLATAPELQVPLGAVFDAGKGPGVWIIHGDPARVSWRSVTIVRVGDEAARVAGQLRQGDRIVALGAQLLREGQAVRVAAEGATTATAEVRL
ncbi:efflux RND transporter periplasmic adaptor subunit [Cupriavidus taiwanensis]|uniref:efflux RND transporter periplasmic adaptor subunit n=1 Tax=Cupriavidus taiwanensis TaxID=164546 RepID=UPI000E1B3A0F|nr:efflux RND transporter periplasmic adaptor subunit [Cupriavidus taiwanensis]SOZ33457.1 RND efflux membrane fusion protein [Cupriavidus taiwanensis]SPA38200.1 RND efflux membrane fusion protein [Cupriavidus taiwanensis]